MEKKSANPWKWQDNFGFSQTLAVKGSTQTLLCAGQAAIGEDGLPRHKNDMEAQLKLTLANIETVITTAGFDWTNIVRLTIFTTDFDQLFQHYPMITAALEGTDPKPVINLIGVSRLVFPELLVEIEATAMR